MSEEENSIMLSEALEDKVKESGVKYQKNEKGILLSTSQFEKFKRWLLRGQK